MNSLIIAKYILSIYKKLTTLKLQKLVYYSQVWSLVWEGKPLFEEDFEAWALGPVEPNLYEKHKGIFEVNYDTFLTDINIEEIDKKSNRKHKNSFRILW